MSTSERWGVNGHTTRCTSSVSVVLQLRRCPAEGSGNGDQRRLYNPLRLGKGLYFTFLYGIMTTLSYFTDTDTIIAYLRLSSRIAG